MPAPGGDVVLTDHFTLSEFECKCGCGLMPDMTDPHFLQLVRALESLRAKLSAYEGTDCQIIVESGIRCVDHNRAVGGARNSYHLAGWAADIYSPGIPTEKLYRLALSELDLSGLIIYPEKHTIHCDVGDRILLADTRNNSINSIWLGSKSALGFAAVWAWMFLAGI